MLPTPKTNKLEHVILGIDPGLHKTGYGIIQKHTNLQAIFISCGKIRTSTKDNFFSRLGDIFTGISKIIEAYKPDEVVIEKVFMNMNPQSTLLLGQARGASICAAIHHVKPVFEYTALQIKKSVVGHGHAQKEQVQFMVRQLLQLPQTPTEDAADALACALCHLAHTRRD